MIANFLRAFQNVLKAVTFPAPEHLEEGLQDHLRLGSRILLALQKISDLKISAAPTADQLRALLEIFAETIQFPVGLIELYEPELEQLRVLECYGPSYRSARGTTTPIGQTLSGTVISTQQSMIWAQLGDPLALPQLSESSGLESAFQTVFSLPLIVHQRVVGVLTLAHSEYRSVGEYGIEWLESLATYAASLLEASQQNQEQLQSKERLDLIALGLHGVIYDLDLPQRQMLRSEGLLSLLGYAESDLGTSLDRWVALIHPEDRFKLITFLEEQAHSHREYDLTYRVRRHSHEYLDVCDRGIVRRNEQGEAIRLIGIISERDARAAQTLRDKDLPLIVSPLGAEIAAQDQSVEDNTLIAWTTSADQSVEPSIGSAISISGAAAGVLSPATSIHDSQSILAGLQDAVFQADLQGILIHLNPAWTVITGYTVEESVGQPWSRFVDPEDQQLLNASLVAILGGQTSARQFQMRQVTQNQQTRWVEIHCQPLLEPDGTVQGTVGTLYDITDRKVQESQLRHDAMHDGLTGLPNRLLFLDRLHHVHQNYQRHQDCGFTVLFLDLDRFKVINDRLGHGAGDELLQSVAERLQNCLRPGDTVARFGGDEFTILLPNVRQVEDAVRVSDRVLMELGRSFTLAGTEIYTSVSIGIVISTSPDQLPEDLLRNADIALYRAKSRGKGRYELFVEEMQVRVLKQMELEDDLRRALERQELQVYYQPIHSLPGHQLVGFEALLRWQHPTKGILPPSDFLNIAEETGLLTNISWWVVQSACAQLSAWQQDHQLPPHIYMSINLATQQVGLTNFIDWVQQALSSNQLLPQSLMLEVGESVFVEDGLGAIAKLTQLKNSGVQICLDEFGRRFSSFGDLVRLPINNLKIDRSFVGEMELGNNLEVVRSIITLGHKLGLRVIAEGVESEPQVAQLQALRCDAAQGQFFSLASPADELSYLLDQKFLAAPPALPLIAASSPVLILKTSTQTLQIPLMDSRSWSLGRNPESTVVLSDRWASRDHAEIQLMDNGEYYLVDLGSGNGSYVNGQRVIMPVQLKDGDLLTVGHTELEFQSITPDLTHIQDTSVKIVLLSQASPYQDKIWKEALTSQNIMLVDLQSDSNVQEFIEQRVENGEPLPDLLLLDMTTLRPNAYSFCRWCHIQYPQLKVVMTSGTRTEVPSSERQWAVYQGALDLLPAFPEKNLFSSMADVAARIRLVLKILGANPISQQSLASALVSIQAESIPVMPTSDPSAGRPK